MKNKMKTVGYISYAFAAILSIVGLIGLGDTEVSVVMPLVNTWLAAGTGLLFGNATKRAVGAKIEKGIK